MEARAAWRAVMAFDFTSTATKGISEARGKVANSMTTPLSPSTPSIQNTASTQFADGRRGRHRCSHPSSGFDHRAELAPGRVGGHIGALEMSVNECMQDLRLFWVPLLVSSYMMHFIIFMLGFKAGLRAQLFFCRAGVARCPGLSCSIGPYESRPLWCSGNAHE